MDSDVTVWDAFLAGERELIESIGVPDPPFPYRVVVDLTYDDLFAGNYPAERELDALKLLDEARQHGRVIVHGEAGSGKTTILLRLITEAIEHAHPIYVNLQRWSTPLLEEWRQREANPVARFALLLEQLAVPAVDEVTLRTIVDEKLRLVLIDGLNEVPRDVAPGVLDAVDHFARRNTLAGVIVTDRLTRRALPSDHWGIAHLQPVDAETVRHFLGDRGEVGESIELYQRPFFLNLAVHEGLPAASSAEGIAAFLRKHAQMTSEELEMAACGAFAMYEAHESRTFEFESFAQIASRAIADKLEGSNVLRREGADAYFSHHLYHDYLAAYWLGLDSERWTREAFDAVSFHASSFDALALALEQVRESAEADEFLRRIYDWNLYGSAYALAKGRQLESVSVTEQMEVALLTMLAERKWDPLKATAEAVLDALRFVPSVFSQELLAADSFEAVQQFVQRFKPQDDDFAAWQQLFLTRRGENVDDEVVALLTSEQGLLGWTASNALRRAHLRDEQIEGIRELLLGKGEWRARWRAAHALGTHPSSQNAEALARGLRDKDDWVRYGSIRALIEQAAASEELRADIIRMILAEVDSILRDSRTLGELRRALVLREPPKGWAEAVAPLVEELWARALTVEAQDEWRRLAYEVQRSVAA